NEIVELDRGGRVRWHFGGVGYSFDFALLPGNRLLLAEHNKNRVTERNFKGEILWQFDIPSPINCDRLPNGNVFVATSSRVVIADRQKHEVLKVDRYSSIMAGQRMRDGQLVLMLSDGTLVRMDAAGKELGKVKLAAAMNNYGGLQALPNGRVLLALYNSNK